MDKVDRLIRLLFISKWKIIPLYIILISLSYVIYNQSNNTQSDTVWTDNQRAGRFVDRKSSRTNDESRSTVNVRRYKTKSQKLRRISAYNVGAVKQSDSSPCKSANGENICLAVSLAYKRCAANFVYFGTMLEIKGYGRCMVTDRMNERYPDSVDIAMSLDEKQRAKEFGVQYRNVKILYEDTK